MNDSIRKIFLLIGAMIFFLASLFLWLTLSSSYGNVLHTIAKSNFTFTKLGNVNVRLLFVSFLWAGLFFYGYFKVSISKDKFISFMGFELKIFVLITVISFVVVICDSFLEKNALWGGFLWMLQVIIAGGVAKFPLVYEGNNSFDGILHKLLNLTLGLCGLLIATTLILLVFPEVSIR